MSDLPIRENRLLMLRRAGRRSSPAPRHLGPKARAFWREITSAWNLEEHHRRLLELTCGALQRADEAREAVERDGAYQLSKRDGTFRVHPGVAVEREASRTAMRGLRELGFDMADVAAEKVRRAS